MAKLYRLSPATFRALGYTCIGLTIVVILLFLVDSVKRNRLQIRQHREEQSARVDDRSQTIASGTTSTRVGFRDAYLASMIEVVGVCLWNTVVHLSIVSNIEIPAWPFYMIIIGMIYASVAWIKIRYPVTQTEVRQRNSSLALAGLIFAVFSSQFFLLSARNCFERAPLAVYDYYGPVRVVGYNRSRIGRDGKNNLSVLLQKYYFKCPVDEAVGQIQVAWGGNWACPHLGVDHHCSVVVHSNDCDYAVCENCHGGCTQEEYDTTLNASNYCVQNGTLAGFTASWDLIAQGISYDNDVPPADDVHQFATVTMYADCDACQAEFAEIVEEQTSSLTSSVSIFLGVVSGLFSIVYFALVIDAQQKKDIAMTECDSLVETVVELT